jgi:hypothetical protein
VHRLRSPGLARPLLEIGAGRESLAFARQHNGARADANAAAAESFTPCVSESGSAIPNALETDWLAGAAGFEPLHIRIEICQDSQPGGRDSNLRISN